MIPGRPTWSRHRRSRGRPRPDPARVRRARCDVSTRCRFHERLFELADEPIYVENQFLTSQAICDALAGTLERDALRRRFWSPPGRIRAGSRRRSWAVCGQRSAAGCTRADHRGRLRICSRDRREVWPNVHTKLTIVDDRWAYLGSANFANRSMGFDTECGLGLDGTEREDLRAALRGLRHRLLAEHLDVEPDAYRAKESKLGMLGAVDALRGGVQPSRISSPRGKASAPCSSPLPVLPTPIDQPRLTDLFDEFL